MSLRIFTTGLLFLGLLSGCASSKMKERKEQREKVAQSSRLYCEFINGEMYPDIDVALNLEMAKRCDSEKPFSLTNYKTPAENPGILYCCSMATKSAAPAAVFEKPKPAAPAAAASVPAAAPAAKKDEDKKDDKKSDQAE